MLVGEKEMTRNLLLTVIFMFSNGLLAANNETLMPLNEGAIIVYFDHYWIPINYQPNIGYYRKLLKIDADGEYLVQDFYLGYDTKESDPFVIVDKSQLTSVVKGPDLGDLALLYPTTNSEGILSFRYVQLGTGNLSIFGDETDQRVDKRLLKKTRKNEQWTRWYENGQKAWQVKFHKNQQTGEWHSWYYNGQLKSRGQFNNNSKDGIWKFWDMDGNKRLEAQYMDDEKVAQWRF